MSLLKKRSMQELMINENKKFVEIDGTREIVNEKNIAFMLKKALLKNSKFIIGDEIPNNLNGTNERMDFKTMYKKWNDFFLNSNIHS